MAIISLAEFPSGNLNCRQLKFKPMRYSQEQIDTKHQAIIDAASQMFREHGFEAAQGAIGAPIFGQLNGGAGEVTLVFFELGFKALE